MPRDYRTEYRRRLERASAAGLSRSQARGHPRPGEPPVRALVSPEETADRLNKALRVLRATNNQALSARSQGVSVNRFRKFLRQQGLATRSGRRWEVTDERPRQVVAISDGRQKLITVAGFDRASEVMQHRHAVASFLDTNDPAHLQPWEGWAVLDTAGRAHRLETRPNVLYRLAAAGNEGFENVYRLIQ